MLVGNLIYAGCQWGMLVAIARLGDALMVGQFALALAITTPIFLLTNLNLRYVQVTDSADRFQPCDFMSLQVITSAIAFLLVFAIAIFAQDNYDMILLILAMAGVKVTELFCDVIYGIHNKRECMRAICIGRVSRGFLSFLSIIVLLPTTQSLTISIVGLALVNVLVLVAVDVPLALRSPGVIDDRPFALHCNVRRLGPLAWLSLPLGLGTLLLSLNTNIPRYFIGHYLDEVALGYYAAAAYLLVATDLVVQSSRITALPRLAKLFVEQRSEEFWKLTLRLIIVGIGCAAPAFITVWIAGEPILVFIYGEEYRPAANSFFWLSFASLIWQASVPTAVLLAMQCYWIDFAIRLVTVGVVAGASWTLIPQYGLVAAAWAIVLGRITASIGTAIFATWNFQFGRARQSCSLQVT